MMEIFFQTLSLIASFLAFITTIFLARSNVRFTKGELQKIIEYFVWGTIFMFGVVMAQLQVDILHLTGTLIDFMKYFFMIVGFSFFLLASYKTYNLSKVLGFSSKNLPKKLKRVLKS